MNHTLLKAIRSVIPVVTIGIVGGGFTSSAAASSIENVSLEDFQCIQEHSSTDRGHLTFPSSNSGTINAYADVLDIWGGSVDFTYNPTSQTLTITNPQGPGGEKIEEGLQDVAQQCINGEFDEEEE
jgi:hypothetical protein